MSILRVHLKINTLPPEVFSSLSSRYPWNSPFVRRPKGLLLEPRLQYHLGARMLSESVKEEQFLKSELLTKLNGFTERLSSRTRRRTTKVLPQPTLSSSNPSLSISQEKKSSHKPPPLLGYKSGKRENRTIAAVKDALDKRLPEIAIQHLKSLIDSSLYKAKKLEEQFQKQDHEEHQTESSPEESSISPKINLTIPARELLTGLQLTRINDSLEAILVYLKKNTTVSAQTNYKMARETFEMVRSYQIKIFQLNYSLMINFAADTHDSSRAEVYFEAMKAYYKPNIVTYNSLLKVFASTLNIGKAEHYLKELRFSGLSPDEATFRTLMALFGNAKNLEGLIQIFKEFQKAERGPDLAAYNHMLDILTRFRDPKLVDDHLHLMNAYKKKPNVITYNILIKFYASLGNRDQTLKYYEQLLLSDKSPQNQTFTSLMDLCSRTKSRSDILAFYEEFKIIGLEPDLVNYNALLTALDACDAFHDAQFFFGEMRARKLKPDSVTYRILFQLYNRLGTESDIYELYRIAAADNWTLKGLRLPLPLYEKVKKIVEARQPLAERK